MPGYTTRDLVVHVDGVRYDLRALSDRQQYADPHGSAERAGVLPAHWSLFGQLWPASEVLALAMSAFAVAGKRVLELGCGLALSSLVLKRRGADILASDHHPLAESFLRHNARANSIDMPAYLDLPWSRTAPTLGRFELLIGSDVLYERGHVALLAALVRRHAARHAEVVVTDPGRGERTRFTAAMLEQGFETSETAPPFNDGEPPPHRGRLMHYCR
jgi:predicted nicotinamide N-methyase